MCMCIYINPFSVKCTSMEMFEKQKFNSDVKESTAKIIFQVISLFTRLDLNKNEKY